MVGKPGAGALLTAGFAAAGFGVAFGLAFFTGCGGGSFSAVGREPSAFSTTTFTPFGTRS